MEKIKLSIPDTRTKEEKDRMDRIDEEMAKQYLAAVERIRKEKGDE